MPRGRRAIPDEIKLLRGNPGKRKLHLDSARDGSAVSAIKDAPRPPLQIPEFLTEDREREIFRRVVEDYLQRRFARSPDLTVYGRWATYMHKWMHCKELLVGKKSLWVKGPGEKSLPQRHPVFKVMLDLERTLLSLEDRLGLTPVARQHIIRGLAAMPPAMTNALEESEERQAEAPAIEEEEVPEAPAISPLGFLQSGTKPH